MSTALVTGGLGGVGRWTIATLLERGWDDIACVDVQLPGGGLRPNTEGWDERVSFYAVELTEQGQTWELVEQINPDTVVHLGAIPNPQHHAGTHVFENNVVSTYNTLVAAGRAGARIASASSEAVYGFIFTDEQPRPEYLPIDECHPTHHDNQYSTSKMVGEEIGKMVARKYDTQVASIRPSWVQHPGRYLCLQQSGLPATGTRTFWAYVDVRDIASIFCDALEADFEGHEAFTAAAADNYLGTPTTELFEEHVGPLPERCDIEGDESPYSTMKAREMLGWSPQHSWQLATEEDIPLPFS